MKKFLIFSLVTFGTSILSYAGIKVELPKDCNLNAIDYYYAPIKQFAEAKTRAERGVVADRLELKNSEAEINIPSEANGYMYVFNIDNEEIRFYATHDENIILKVESCNPLSYSLSGSDLVKGINELSENEKPLINRAMELNESGQGDSEEMQALANQYLELQKNFIKNNPDSPAAPVALMNLEGEEFINTYEALNQNMKNSILYPLVKNQYEREKKGLEMEKKQQALQSGNVNAPNFTLKDIEGKDVSLTDFRGKWVILDFWGTWCPWCIKGFPELKEAYETYKGKLEIIGIDCNEGEDAWKEGVKKYELPWVNVYNPADSGILGEYGVQGFPTKAIISPEGKISNITVGHNPQFFQILSALINKE